MSLFPQHKHVQITAIGSTHAGWESDLFTINLSYIENTAQIVKNIMLKMYHGEKGTEKAFREFEGMKLLAQSGYPVPKVLSIAPDNNAPFGQTYIAMEYISGHTLGELLRLSHNQHKESLVKQFCHVYVDLHALDWKTFVSVDAHYDTRTFIGSWLTTASILVEQLQPHIFTPVLYWLQEKSKEVVCSRLSVIHGDFHHENFLLQEDHIAFVIDWTAMEVADYRFDLAWTLLLLNTLGYEEIATLVRKEYERISGQPIEQFEFFEVIACTRRLVDIATALSIEGTTTLGMRAEVAAILKQRVDHICLVYAQLQDKTGCSLPEIEHLILTLSS